MRMLISFTFIKYCKVKIVPTNCTLGVVAHASVSDFTSVSELKLFFYLNHIL